MEMMLEVAIGVVDMEGDKGAEKGFPIFHKFIFFSLFRALLLLHFKHFKVI